jgi:large subunit ribosomal protein L9
MNVILKQPVKNLGDMHDLVSVKPGYARNFLIPKGMAIVATDSNVRMIEEIKRQASHKQAHVKQQAQDIADKLANTTVELEMLAGSDGKLFGSVTTLQIAARLKDLGFDIDRKLSTVDDIRSLGEYKAMIHLHKEVKAEIGVNLIHKAG